MKALVLDAERRTANVVDITKPVPAPTEVLVEVRAIALNPVDALYTYHPLGRSGRVLGSDFAGIVSELGSSVPKSSKLKAGSKVAGFLQGACSVNDRPGAFAEYLTCPWDLVWQINDLDFEEAATVSLCALTAAQALFLRLGIPAPFPTNQTTDTPGPKSLVINGGSASVALYAAQLARASSASISLFGTASPKHFSMLKDKPYSYNSVADYRSSDWTQNMLSANGDQSLDVGFDCISEGRTVLNTAKTLRQGGKLAVVRSRQGKAWNTSTDELGLEPSYGAVWQGLGEDVEYVGMTLPADAGMRAFTVAFYAWLSEGGKIVPNRVRLMPGGLEEVVEDGFVLMGSGTMDDRQVKRTEDWMKPVSGEKLVYRIQQQSTR